MALEDHYPLLNRLNDSLRQELGEGHALRKHDKLLDTIVRDLGRIAEELCHYDDLDECFKKMKVPSQVKDELYLIYRTLMVRAKLEKQGRL